MAFKEYDFGLTETAESDIDATYEYIAETLGNPDAASDLADELEIQIDKICKRPETGKLVENEFLRRNDIWRTSRLKAGQISCSFQLICPAYSLAA